MAATPETYDLQAIKQSMFSFERPASMLWNAVGQRLTELGWNASDVEMWLMPKHARYALDGDLGEAIETLGRSYAEHVAYRP